MILLLPRFLAVILVFPQNDACLQFFFSGEGKYSGQPRDTARHVLKNDGHRPWPG